jgi:hypothetical protein
MHLVRQYIINTIAFKTRKLNSFYPQRRCPQWFISTPNDELVGTDTSTQVATPYVNHVPTMTGGVGYADLARFYKVSLPRCSNSAFTCSSLSIISQL